MNVFIGVGIIADVNENGRVLKFNLAIKTKQEKPCLVPCLIFDPNDEIKDFVEYLQTTEQAVWLQGRISCNEYEYQGRTIRKIQVVTYAKSIKII